MSAQGLGAVTSPPQTEGGSGAGGDTPPRPATIMRATPDEIIARLDAYTVKGRGDCLVWTANVDPDGYGWAYFPGWVRSGGTGTPTDVHVFAYAVYHGIEHLPLDGHVDHLCFNRLCCNPNHLRLIPAVENSAHRRSYSQWRERNRRLNDQTAARRARIAAETMRRLEEMGLSHLATRKKRGPA